MDFYTEKVLPMIEKTCDVLEKTPQMQDILHGTMPDGMKLKDSARNSVRLVKKNRCFHFGCVFDR